jgi:hypothetical protein
MVDCFDRIAVQMTEIALEPVRMLKDRKMLSAISLRTPSGGGRFTITIEKRFPDGTDEAPHYHWSLLEITLGGEPVENGGNVSSGATPVFREPEDAYWGAVDALCAFQKGRS